MDREDGEKNYSQAKNEFERLRQEIEHARLEERFGDAASLFTECLAARKSYHHIQRFSQQEQLELWTQRTDILLQCPRLEPFHIDPPPDELEQDAHNLDPVHWGKLCFNIGLLYLRYSPHQSMTQAKKYLNLALQSYLRTAHDRELLEKLCQILLDVYNLTEDNGSAKSLVDMINEQVSPNLEVDPEQIRDVNHWCENEGFNLWLRYQQLVKTTSDQKAAISNYFTEDTAKKTSPMELALKEGESTKFLAMLRFTCYTSTLLETSDVASQMLLFAADTRNSEYIQPLLHAGADPNFKDDRGRTALHHCQYCPTYKKKGGLKMVNSLLDREPGLLNRQDDQLSTALFMASEEGHVNMMKLLLDRGADPTIPDIHTKTPLHELCYRGDLIATRTLLGISNFASIINQRGPRGETPLIIATREASKNSENSDRANIVRELVKKNADPYIQDDRGHNAFQWASGPHESQIKDILNVAAANGASQSSASHSQSAVPSSGHSQVVANSPPPKQSRFVHYNYPKSSTSRSNHTSSSNDRSSTSYKSSRLSTKPSTVSLAEFPGILPAQNKPETIHEKDEDGKSSLPDDDDRATPPNHNEPRPISRLGNTFKAFQRSLQNQANRVRERSPSSEEASGSEEDQHDETLDDLNLQRMTLGSPAPVIPRGAIRERPAQGHHNNGGNFSAWPLFNGSASGHSSGFGAGRSQENSNGPPPFNNQGNGGQPPNSPMQDPNDTEPSRTFACPYAKAFPISFPDCLKKNFKRQREVKQHLKSCHWKPYCPICYHEFGNIDDRDRHIKQKQCLERPESTLRTMTDAQKESVEKPQKGPDDNSKWFQIFKIVCPTSTLPSTPYSRVGEPLTLEDIQIYLEGFNKLIVSMFSQVKADRIIPQSDMHKAAAEGVLQLQADLRKAFMSNPVTPSGGGVQLSANGNAFDSDPQGLESIAMGSRALPLDPGRRSSGSGRLSSGSSQVPPNYGHHASGSGQTPLGSGQMPSDYGRMPSNYGRMPSNYNQHPSGSGQMPSYYGHMPSNYNQHPSGSGQMPSNYGHMPSNYNHHPSGSGQMPSNYGHMPSNYGHMPSNYNHHPSGSGQMPWNDVQMLANYNQKPLGSAEMPSSSGQIPSSSGKMPSNDAQMPGNYNQMPANYNQMPLSSGQMPSNHNQMPSNYDPMSSGWGQLPAQEPDPPPQSTYEHPTWMGNTGFPESDAMEDILDGDLASQPYEGNMGANPD